MVVFLMTFIFGIKFGRGLSPQGLSQERAKPVIPATYECRKPPTSYSVHRILLPDDLNFN